MKSILKKVVLAVMMVCLLSTTTALAESFNYSLKRGEYGYSTLIVKNTNTTYARVQRQYPASPETYVQFTVVNSANTRKSESKTLYGIATVNLSYDGYNVQNGDFIKLRGFNLPGENNGYSITASGTWTP